VAGIQEKESLIGIACIALSARTQICILIGAIFYRKVYIVKNQILPEGQAVFEVPSCFGFFVAKRPPDVSKQKAFTRKIAKNSWQ
jgi:hypothetical protein